MKCFKVLFIFNSIQTELQTSLIKKCLRLLGFLLVGISEIAFADWQQITKTYQSTGYVDRSSIQKKGDVTSMNVLIDYEKPPFDGNNLSYRSLTLSSEYNCTTNQFRILKLTSHLKNMATGPKPYHSDEPSEWHAVPTTSVQNGFLKVACEK